MTDFDWNSAENDVRTCEAHGCEEPGVFRAPRARDQLNSYRWFCLEHVRAYNAAWDYCAGMSAEEIDAMVRADVTWQRPSWPFSGAAELNGRSRAPFQHGFEIDDDIWQRSDRDSAKNGQRGPHNEGKRARDHRSEEQKALAVLDLSPPVTLQMVKTRYIALVKRLHPDANGGDKGAEERLKLVNQAYATLKSAGAEWVAR